MTALTRYMQYQAAQNYGIFAENVIIYRLMFRIKRCPAKSRRELSVFPLTTVETKIKFRNQQQKEKTKRNAISLTGYPTKARVRTFIFLKMMLRRHST